MDKYDHAIQYLQDSPDEIYDIWAWPIDHPAGCLFAYVGRAPAGKCGCLTQIRAGKAGAYTMEGEYCPDLTEKIRRDTRIPDTAECIRPEDLPIFAEWQRWLDSILGEEVDRRKSARNWSL